MKYVVLIYVFIFSSSIFAQQGVDSWNFNFGLGVEQYRIDYIEQASIFGGNRVVTIEKEFQTRPSAWLTLSWNVWGLDESLRSIDSKGNGIDVNTVKFGFFAGTKIIGEDSSAFESFAIGPQITFQAKDRDISIGLGWVTHPTRTLANGITAGESLPEQFDDIVYVEGTENSYMLMFSIAL